MPYILVNTNVSKDLITEEFIQSLGDVLAKTLDRPREKCIVHVSPGKLRKKSWITIPNNHIMKFLVIFKMRKYHRVVLVTSLLVSLLCQ